MLERQLLVVMMGFLPGFGSAYLAFNVCGVLLWFHLKGWPFEGFIATLVRRTRSPYRGQKICHALVSRDATITCVAIPMQVSGVFHFLKTA